MGDIKTTSERLESLDVWEITLHTLSKYTDEIVELNKEQLLDGRTTKDSDITPKISNDPFFKSTKSADKYRRRKISKGFAVARDADLPSFKMSNSGTVVHSKISAYIDGDYIEVTARGKAASFDTKWRDIYGLSRKNLDKLIARHIDEIRDNVRKYILG